MKNHAIILAYLLFTLFLGLRLSGEIAWSWWWVFAPLWVYPVLALGVGFVIGLRQELGKEYRRKGSNPPSPYLHGAKPRPPANPPKAERSANYH